MCIVLYTLAKSASYSFPTSRAGHRHLPRPWGVHAAFVRASNDEIQAETRLIVKAKLTRKSKLLHAEVDISMLLCIGG